MPFDAVGLMRERTPFTKEIIDALPNLKLIVTSGKQNAAIDLDAANARSVTVCGTSSPRTRDSGARVYAGNDALP